MPKAIKITIDTKAQIENNFLLDEDELEGMEGLYFVADFGAEKGTYGFLNKTALDHAFVMGEDIENGFFEVSRK